MTKTIKVWWTFGALATRDGDIEIMQRACQMLNQENPVIPELNKQTAGPAIHRGPRKLSPTRELIEELADAAVLRAARELNPDATEKRIAQIAEYVWYGGGVGAQRIEGYDAIV